eukprot:Amastigsp_a256_251.p3 type:complete len:147 gc:universal Amastigsp_a256_251:353-793(+)
MRSSTVAGVATAVTPQSPVSEYNVLNDENDFARLLLATRCPSLDERCLPPASAWWNEPRIVCATMSANESGWVQLTPSRASAKCTSGRVSSWSVIDEPVNRDATCGGGLAAPSADLGNAANSFSARAQSWSCETAPAPAMTMFLVV